MASTGPIVPHAHVHCKGLLHVLSHVHQSVKLPHANGCARNAACARLHVSSCPLVEEEKPCRSKMAFWLISSQPAGGRAGSVIPAGAASSSPSCRTTRSLSVTPGTRPGPP